MESSVDWLLDALRASTATSLSAILARHRSRDDDFDLADLLAFLPAKQHADLARLLRTAVAPSLSAVADAPENAQSTDDPDDDLAAHVDAVRAAAELVWLFVNGRKEPVAEAMRDVIVDLHGVLLAMPSGQPQNLIAKICEWVWKVGDEARETIVPQTMLYLLLRTFGGETEALRTDEKPMRSGGSPKDVARVYAMRQSLDYLELSETHPESETIRNLLMRCSTSAVYLRVDQGRKFLAYLLSVEGIRDAVLATLLNQIASVRTTRANYFGGVFLVAWKHDKSQWMFDTATTIAEMAICAGTEPFATNLRTVMASFHSNKRVVGIDDFLNRIYGPVLYKNLMVANARVRRNAVMIMADAFPIHDPSALMQDIEQTIAFQCGKLLDLLDDPAPIVRKATIEGTCRILGLLWELVPLASAKKMIDTITTKLAFDAASAQVRVAVFEGLKFLAQNHLALQAMSIAVPRLGCLIHDNVEKVRLSFLDLLVTLKSKRIKTLRYFDVVPLDDLLMRLPIESPAASQKIMYLIQSSYFPLEKKGKTAEEVASSQVRACLSMLHTSEDACNHFYRNINLHVPPGPLCEFAMRLSTIALDLSVEDDDIVRRREKTKSPPTRPSTRRTRRRSRTKARDENEPPPHENIISNEGALTNKNLRSPKPDRVALLQIVADVLASLLPSLAKEANSALRTYIDDIFGGEALKSLLIERGNTFQSRAVSWRIASCMSYSQMGPIAVIWRQQLNTVLHWPRRTEEGRKNFEVLLSALILCGLRWNLLKPLSGVFAGWADAATSGHRSARLGTKSFKKSKSGKQRRSFKLSTLDSSPDSHQYMTRCDALFVLRSSASVLMDNLELREAFNRSLTVSSCNDADGTSQTAEQLIHFVRKGCIGAIEFVLENHSNESISEEQEPAPHILLDALSHTWKLSLTRLADEQCSDCFLEEFRELLQWSSGKDLLGQAARVNSSFARALASLILGYSADAAAIGCLDTSDMSFLEMMAENVKSHVDFSEAAAVTRPVVEMLRMSYQVGEHYVYQNGTAEEQKAPAALLETSRSLLLIGCGIMKSSRAHDDYLTGCSHSLTILEEFLFDAITVKCHCDDPELFGIMLADVLRTSFENADEAERNLFASSICNIVRCAVTNPPKGMRTSAAQLHDLILSCVQRDSGNGGSKKALVNYLFFLVTAIQSFYEESEMAPNDDVRQFLASLDVSLMRQFPTDDGASFVDEETQGSLLEIRRCLARLKKICQSSAGVTESARAGSSEGEDPHRPSESTVAPGGVECNPVAKPLEAPIALMPSPEPRKTRQKEALSVDRKLEL